jgi:glycosyltransferase involved in cell wall biosynthesis
MSSLARFVTPDNLMLATRHGAGPTSRRALNVVRFGIQNTLLMWGLHRRAAPAVPGRVSIITATYNRPALLAEAIDSVKSQTYGNWEQIVVSDGPDPRVDALVAQSGDERVRALHTSRFPVMGNYQRNVGLTHATGEYVLYVDDDNIIYPQCLEAMVGGFSDPSVGFVVCPIRYGTGIMHPLPDFRHNGIDLLNFMVRRDLVIRARGQNSRYSADFHLISKIARISNGLFLDTLIGHHR